MTTLIDILQLLKSNCPEASVRLLPGQLDESVLVQLDSYERAMSRGYTLQRELPEWVWKSPKVLSVTLAEMCSEFLDGMPKQVVPEVVERLTRDPQDPDELIEYQVELRYLLEPVWDWFNSDEHDEKPLLQVVKEVVGALQAMSRGMDAYAQLKLEVGRVLHGHDSSSHSGVFSAKAETVAGLRQAYNMVHEELHNG